MGTRGLLGFLVNGVRRGSYNHWDSYPSGLGAAIVEFILPLDDEQVKTMAARVAALEWADDTTVDRISMAEPLPEILAGTRTTMPDSSYFIDNDLFCEWAYYMDFDNKILEIWAAGQHVDTVQFAELTLTFMDEWKSPEERDEEEDVDSDDNGDGEQEEKATAAQS